jgi:hypothetical protein
MSSPKRFFAALDLGQVSDFSTLAVIERVELVGEWDPVVFAWEKRAMLRLRFLERIPLGTPYPEVVRRVNDVMRQVAAEGTSELVVDGTGVGRPVVDLLRCSGLRCSLRPAIVTGGIAESYSDGFCHIPKKDLITGLQVALQQGTLQIAAGMKFGPALVMEMADMRVKITSPGNEQFGAWREGTHDDLVFAVALAVWAARKAYPRDIGGKQEYWNVYLRNAPTQSLSCHSAQAGPVARTQGIQPAFL